jgi:hypothetical protein
MDNSTAMKSKVLEMLEHFMMGEHGKRMKPKVLSVEVMSDKPNFGKGSMDDVLKRASEENDGIEFEDDGVDSFAEECDDDDEDNGPAGKRKSPKDYFKSKGY